MLGHRGLLPQPDRRAVCQAKKVRSESRSLSQRCVALLDFLALRRLSSYPGQILTPIGRNTSLRVLRSHYT